MAIIDLKEERERRKLERWADPYVRDMFEAATAYVVLLCALGTVIWVLLQAR